MLKTANVNHKAAASAISWFGSDPNARTCRRRLGARGAHIDGGTGSDKLFLGADAGADSFRFQTGLGRDNVYRFDVDTDRITVDIAGVDATDIELQSINGGRDIVVTFTGVEGNSKIILLDVTIVQIEEGPSELFVFGAGRTYTSPLRFVLPNIWAQTRPAHPPHLGDASRRNQP
ncbi:hypothetical protein ASF26_20620 [Methylobacterium sp. Leaf93]|nr:hypothetical protein ASF26_20620 [Methylobacterium sp. Leaf93]